MCGLAGILSYGEGVPPPRKDELERMIATLWHRGPDSCGFHRDERAGLAHARLSIIDLVSGDQPMANEDGTLHIVFNGEIFNYIELREILLARGHRFCTRSDTEVVLHAYEEWGTECFSRFNGQWALAIRDSRKGQVLLCRDRVGICPLFVTRAGGRVLFASEIKALLADPGVVRRIDARGLAEVFTWWSAVAPRTLFEGVEEIPPGTFRLYQNDGGHTSGRYWRVSFRGDGGGPATREECAEQLGERLRAAVRLRMTRADVPVGSYLSGGLDSSVITRLACEYASGVFRTYSVRFTDGEFDESPYQKMIVDATGSEHSELLITRAAIAGIFPEVIRHTEQPVLRTAPAPMFLLSQLVRERGCKTVLTGEGADEFLAGYDIFREAKIRSFWARQPDSVIRPQLFSRVYPYLQRSPRESRALANAFWKVGFERSGHAAFSHERRWSSTASLHRFFTPELRERAGEIGGWDLPVTLPPEFVRWDELERAQFLEIETLLSGYLLSSQGDRMLMSHGVEGRFPYLDDQVTALACSMAPGHKLPGLNEKAVLKLLAKDLLPAPILARPKQPYRAPDAVCFLGPEAPSWCADVLSEETLTRAHLFVPAAVRHLVRKLAAGFDANPSRPGFSNTDTMAFVGILSAQLLQNMLIDSAPDDRSGRSRPWRVAVDTVDRSGPGSQQKRTIGGVP